MSYSNWYFLTNSPPAPDCRLADVGVSTKNTTKLFLYLVRLNFPEGKYMGRKMTIYRFILSRMGQKII